MTIPINLDGLTQLAGGDGDVTLMKSTLRQLANEIRFLRSEWESMADELSELYGEIIVLPDTNGPKLQAIKQRMNGMRETAKMLDQVWGPIKK